MVKQATYAGNLGGERCVNVCVYVNVCVHEGNTHMWTFPISSRQGEKTQNGRLWLSRDRVKQRNTRTHAREGEWEIENEREGARQRRRGGCQRGEM